MPSTHFLKQSLSLLPFVLLIQSLSNWYHGLYRMLWRYASIPDLTRIIRSSIVGTILITMFIFFYTDKIGFPRSIPILFCMSFIALSAGARLIYRWCRDYNYWFRSGKGVLIIGTDRAGEYLARELIRDPQHRYNPVGFLDYDHKNKGKNIQGIPVLGIANDLHQYVKKLDINMVFIAVPNITSESMKQLIDSCKNANIEFRILPNLRDMIDGKLTIESFRPVSIEDLLGREEISLSWDKIKSDIDGAEILITGGGGSIGSELCRQIATLNPKKLIVIDNSEYNLFELELTFKENFPEINLLLYLCSVTDKEATQEIFSQHQIDIVFHAAAYKHVPILEKQIRSAITNNVFGTRNIADLARAHQIKTFILISTDKSVNPANIMGCSKRIAEVYCQNLDEVTKQTKFVTVRFGNVIASKGSVLPIFESQLKAGGPITVTHPDVTRFFMSIPEAVELILQATSMGEGGEIFVLQMGQSIKIKYLAEQYIRLSGLRPYEDIKIVYTGLRPGEKLYEELFHEGENIIATHHEKILRAQSRHCSFKFMEEQLSYLDKACRLFDETSIVNIIERLVPENCLNNHIKKRPIKNPEQQATATNLEILH